ncbi:hypothetical protein EDD11_009435 [Mortierella claussenii]|nr:hypothetical protein EDD11_009435 [Mortierella claussenii]
MQSTSYQSQQHRNATNAPSQGAGISSEKGGMGDGMVNQAMKEDLESWIAAIGLAPDAPVNVVGIFGQCRDLNVVERVLGAATATESNVVTEATTIEEAIIPVCSITENNHSFGRTSETGYNSNATASKAGLPLGLSDKLTAGDIHVYVDRPRNSLVLQHAYLYDTDEMLSVCLQSVEAVQKDHTSPDLNLDPQIISVLTALSTIKKQIMQELDRFMTICWDRIGVQSPEQQRQQQQSADQSGTSNNNRGSNSLANVFTPGKCVPVLVFVIERVSVLAPWHEPGASDIQIVEQLKQQVLKKSVDALQTRLRYVFRASRLIQSLDQPAGVFDNRQLFVLPSPSSTPFVHVIPQFTVQMHLPQRHHRSIACATTTTAANAKVLDPAQAVLCQKMKSGSSHHSRRHKHGGAKDSFPRRSVENTAATTEAFAPVVEPHNQEDSFGIPTLRALYDAAILTRDQSLDGENDAMPVSSAAKASVAISHANVVSLGSLHMDYTGPLLTQFVFGWLEALTSHGGYGSAVGKRNAGNVEVPTLQQWIAGCLGVCEGLGMGTFTAPVLKNEMVSTSLPSDGDRSASGDQRQVSTEDQGLSAKMSKVSIGSGGGGGGGGNGGGRRSGNGKRYSQRCANMVQKKIQDYILTDDVMDELYGQKTDGAATTAATATSARAHSERYHQLKADQATKLFQSLAHRR